MGEFPILTSDHAGAVRDFGFCKVAKTCSQPWHMLVWQSDVKVRHRVVSAGRGGRPRPTRRPRKLPNCFAPISLICLLLRAHPRHHASLNAWATGAEGRRPVSRRQNFAITLSELIEGEIYTASDQFCRIDFLHCSFLLSPSRRLPSPFRRTCLTGLSGD